MGYIKENRVNEKLKGKLRASNSKYFKTIIKELNNYVDKRLDEIMENDNSKNCKRNYNDLQ